VPAYKNAAYQLAVSSHLPDVQFLMDEWSPTAEEVVKPVLQSLASDHLHNVKVEKYVKKPYPASFFVEFEEQAKELDELTIAAAKLVIEQDKVAAGKLIREIQRKSQGLKTEAAKAAYSAIADRLATKLDLGKK